MLRGKARLSAGFRQGTAVMALFLGGGDELPQAGGGDGGTQPYGQPGCNALAAPGSEEGCRVKVPEFKNKAVAL